MGSVPHTTTSPSVHQMSPQSEQSMLNLIKKYKKVAFPMGPVQSPNKITQIGRGKKIQQEAQIGGMDRGQFYGKSQQLFNYLAGVFRVSGEHSYTMHYLFRIITPVTLILVYWQTNIPILLSTSDWHKPRLIRRYPRSQKRKFKNATAKFLAKTPPKFLHFRAKI